jgi:hypothetical protein
MILCLCSFFCIVKLLTFVVVLGIDMNNDSIGKFDRQVIDDFHDFCDDFSHLRYSVLVYEFCRSRDVDKNYLLSLLN